MLARNSQRRVREPQEILQQGGWLQRFGFVRLHGSMNLLAPQVSPQTLRLEISPKRAGAILRFT
jgi:hypothetical protein